VSEKPILFSAPMVRAILAGTKRQTRRVVKEPGEARVFGRHSIPEHHHADGPGGFGLPDEMYLHWAYGGGDFADDLVKHRLFCPYGRPGDHLWVKETFSPWADRKTQEYARDCRDRDASWPCVYRATTGDAKSPLDVGGCERWKPSIYMPRALSRITLRIDAVRVQRLHSLTEEDAVAEGVEPLVSTETWSYHDPKISAFVEALEDPTGQPGVGSVYHHAPKVLVSAGDRFSVMWNEINGDRAPWATNPWVWALTISRVLP
jgi:hypothetical protein